MITTDFEGFFGVSAGAAAGLLGLIFVAVSLAPERILAQTAEPERQIAAATAFIALGDAFFLSLGGAVPHWNLGWVLLGMGVIVLSSSVIQAAEYLRSTAAPARTRRLVLATAGPFLYIVQLGLGIWFVLVGADLITLSLVVVVLFALYLLGLVRAWQLLGARSTGIFTYLSPLRSLFDSAPPRDAAAGGTTPPHSPTRAVPGAPGASDGPSIS
jgi:hypothetical protein